MSTPGHDEVVRRSFERQVPLFTGPASPFASRSGSLAWIEPLDADMIVLDVACGAGHAAEAVAPHVRQVVGIDLTPALLTLGGGRLREAGLMNVLLQEGNAKELPFVSESFDVVFCRSSLHHFNDPDRAVAEMVRVCRHHGRIVLVDLIAPDARLRDRFDHVHRLLDPSHVRSLLEDELADLLRRHTGELTHAGTSTARLPLDIAISEQSESDAVARILRDELAGTGEPTGLEPNVEDGKIVVDFMTCVVQAERR